MKKKQKIIVSAILCIGLYLFTPIISFAIDEVHQYPDYAQEYLGEDKYEKFNRKMFNLNMRLNKYALRPIHILWASIIPKYGMDRIQNVYTNIQYPKRLLSSIIQKDFNTTKNETIRFLTNSTIGLGGMFDTADRFFKIEQRDEGMEEALAKCKIKQGPYLVMPWLVSTSPRGMAGALLDNALNPSTYIGTPVVAMVKAGLTVNRTCFMQPLIKMIESTYADPYDITKKMYGLERYIKIHNLDRKNILNTDVQLAMGNEFGNPMEMNQGVEPSNFPSSNSGNLNYPNSLNTYPTSPATQNPPDINNPINKNLQTNPIRRGNDDDITDPPKDKNKRGDGISYNNINKNFGIHTVNELKDLLKADINLENYYPQHPVTDAMRTALFEQEGVNKSIWSEFSIWNKCFRNKIKTASVSIYNNKEPYKYKYILQKDKNSPVAIIYPSIGEGINSHHSTVLAKIFYDEGYSVIIQGSHFQWEFVKSMPDSYKPGIPAHDADYLKLVTHKILDSIENKYKCKFGGKTVIGTSFGAMTSLFLAQKESEHNTLNINKYISINPPIELIYAMQEIDKNTQEWQSSEHLKEKVAITAAKILQLSNLNETEKRTLGTLPFTEEESKLITGFVLHQKLSDLIYTLENTPNNEKTNIYKLVNNMNYEDYAKRYLLSENIGSINDLKFITSLYSIQNYLENNNNYTIYHTMDDYLVNKEQLAELKKIAKDRLILVNNGSHLGYLYRDEFLNSLRNQIKLHTEIIANK